MRQASLVYTRPCLVGGGVSLIVVHASRVDRLTLLEWTAVRQQTHQGNDKIDGVKQHEGGALCRLDDRLVK